MSGRWSRLALRTRISVGLLVLVALTLLAVGAATAHFLREFLTARLDQQLVQSASSVTRPFGRGGGFIGGPSGAQLFGLPPGTLVSELGPDGSPESSVLVVPQGSPNQSVTLTSADVAALAAAPATAADVELSALGEYRALSRERRDDRIVIALPLEPVERTVSRLLLVEGLVFTAALVLLAALGTLLIRRELRPLERVSAAARRVSAMPLASGSVTLNERVTVEAPGTEVGELAGAFNDMVDHVGSSLTARAATEDRLRRFVADASHELRTPLAAIRGYAELFRRAGTTHPEDLARAMSRVEAETRRMGGLVDDLLLLARLDQGRPLRAEPVDLALLAADAAADAQAASPDHPVRLAVPASPVVVTGDADRLRQVLANLLANTRTHTPAGTPVDIEVRPDSTDGTALLAVTDAGPGLPPELVDTAFERFTRADPSRARGDDRDRQIGRGSGLGLSIVAAVVAAHAGAVQLSSRPGRTRIEVRLPLARPDGWAPVPAPAPAPASGSEPAPARQADVIGTAPLAPRLGASG